jgi:hypothetical protein
MHTQHCWVDAWGREGSFMEWDSTFVGLVVPVVPPTSVTARLLPCGVAAAAMLNLLFLALGAVVAAAAGAGTAAGGDIA